MANPIKYDREQVAAKACELFWRKGYHATSTRDIQHAVDMRPGSIYAAFGSKQGLFEVAIRYYLEWMSKRLGQCLGETDAILPGLERFIHLVLIDERENFPCDVCMLVKANAEFDNESPELLALSRSLLERFEARITELFIQAQANGELSKAVPVIDYVRAFQVQLCGLRFYRKCHQDNAVVSQLITQMFQFLRML